MSDQNTDAMNSKHAFEERVVDDTKPIWEQVIKEIVATRKELSKRLDRLEGIVRETRADLRDVEDRLDKLENKPVP